MKSYIIALFSNYFSLAISMAIQIFLFPFLLQRIGPKLTGLYYIFISISNFVAIGISWLSGAGVFLLASSDTNKKNNDIQEVHWVVFLGFTAYATLMLIVISIWGTSAGNWWLTGEKDLIIEQGKNACFLLGIYIWINYIHQADISLFTATLQQGWANFYRIVSQIIFIVFVIYVVLTNPRLDFLMLGNVIGILIAAVAARLQLRFSGKLGPIKWHLPDTGLIKKMFLTTGGGYFLYGITQLALIYGDVLIVGAFLGSEKVSAYLVIWKIPEVIALLLGRISEVLSPYLTRMYSRCGANPMAAIYLSTSRIQHCLGLMCGIAYGYFGVFIVRMWVGESFMPDIPWIYWAAGIVVIFQVVNRHDTIFHYALAKLKPVVIIQIVELFVKTGLTILLFDAFDIAAPIIAMLCVQLAGITWCYRYNALRLIQVPLAEWIRSIFNWSMLFMIISGGSIFIINIFTFNNNIICSLIKIASFIIVTGFTLIMIERFLNQHGVFHLYKRLGKGSI